MDRREMLWSLAASFFEERIACRSDEIRDFFGENGGGRQSLLSAMETLFSNLTKQQQHGNKGKLSRIGLHFLRSSLLMNRAEVMISAYDEGCYLSDTEVTIYWSSELVVQYAEEDMTELAPMLRAKLPRLREYEITELGQMLLANYLTLCTPFMVEVLPCAFQTAAFSKVERLAQVSIDGGEFMGQCVRVYTYSGDGAE